MKLITESHCDKYLREHPATGDVFDEAIISGDKIVSGTDLVKLHFDPMIENLYEKIKFKVNAECLSIEEAKFYIGELSVFARFNSTFLLRASDIMRGFCPELSHELMRNFLEEGGEKGKLPAHYLIFSGALLKDLGLRVNGWVPQAKSTMSLTSMIDVLSWSHCPSTILGMYYATEAVAIAETEMLKEITDRIGSLLANGDELKLDKLKFYYDMHLDEEHEAASNGMSVESGHQEGIAFFIKEAETFNFSQPQIIDGFLQMLNLFVEQWMEISEMIESHRVQLSREY